MTKADFFPTYEEFCGVFHNRQKGQMRKLKQAENTFRSSPKSKDAASTRSKPYCAAPNFASDITTIFAGGRKLLSLDQSSIQPHGDRDERLLAQITELSFRLQTTLEELQLIRNREDELKSKEAQLLASSLEQHST